jgi:NitT/TauT family transport system ATP-binding protein
VNDIPDAPIVALRRVGKAFANAVVALDDFDFTVRHGEFVSLLGPSGCGKSTALRLIAGLTEPTGGAIDWGDAERPRAREHDPEKWGPVFGKDHAQIKKLERDDFSKKSRPALGFVFQEPTLMPWTDVFGNVHLPLKLKGLDRAAAAERVDAALAGVGLVDFAGAYPRELSGGMKMRVSIARALVTAPQLLLMDEPFAALDEITRFRLANDLLKLWQSLGKTVVFVTHSVFESVFLSNRIVVMTPRPGRVFAEIAIDAPYPREESFRTSPEYAGFTRRVSQALADAMAGGTR